MELTPAAQEAIGFADDQFMELSTSGVSIYDLPILSEPSTSSSGRLNRSGGSSSNGSLRKALQQGGAAPAPAKTRDESSLSTSGMSLASLGSLSRLARRPSGLYNVDEALDDSIAWREQGLKVVDTSETNLAADVKEAASAGSIGRTGDAQTVGAGGATAAAVSEAQIHGPPNRKQGQVDDAAGVAPAATRGVLTGVAATESPRAEAVVHGHVQELSLRVAVLRQQSYHRRLAAIPMRSRNSPPPLPVGVDLAPPDEPFPPATVRPQSLPVAAHSAGTLQAISADAWGGERTAAGPGSDSPNENSGAGGSVGGNSSESNSCASSTARRKGGKRASAWAFMRSFGTRHSRESRGAGSTENNNGSAAGGGGDGGSSVTSWSADSSSQGVGRGPSASLANPGSPAPAALAASSNKTLRALSDSASAAVSAATATDGGADTASVSSQEPGGATKRSLLRGRLGQAWASRRKVDKRQSGKTEEGEGVGRERMAAVHGSAVLQPAGGGNGGFAFLPATAEQLGAPPAPDAFPEWLRSRSAPAGPVSPGGNTDGIVDGSSLFPTTPLGRSNRSFDPNLSPSTYDADGSNMSLPPQLGTHSASASLGASFDPNRSTRSWFDMSTESQSRPQPEPSTDLCNHHQQQQVLGNLQIHGRPLRRRTVPGSESPGERESTAAAAALALAAATAAAEVSVAAATRTREAMKANASLFDNDQFVAELSDLSVSGGRRRKDCPDPVTAAPAPPAAPVAPARAGVATANAVNVESDAIKQAGTAAPPAAAAASSAPLATTAGARHSWGGGAAGTGDPKSLSHQQDGEFAGGVDAHRARGGPPSKQQGFNWPAGGGEGRGVGNVNEWSMAMPQSVAGGGDRPQTAPQSSAVWPFVGVSSAAVVPEEARRILGSAAMDGTGGVFSVGVRGVTRNDVGRAPTRAPATSDRGVRARSLDVTLMQQMARGRDARAGWSNGGEAQRWIGAWSHQGADLERNQSDVPNPPVGVVQGSGLAMPTVPPQRSVSEDTSMSACRAPRGGGIGDSNGVRAAGGRPGDGTDIRWPGGGGGGGPAFGGVPQGIEATFQAASAAQPPLDGDDSVRTPPLSSGDQQGAGEPTTRGSWSALHAMIPTPGAATSQRSRRASAPTAGEPVPSDGVRRASDGDVDRALAGGAGGAGEAEGGGEREEGPASSGASGGAWTSFG